jgi:hypothetical protein
MDSGRAPVPSELLCRGASRNVVGDRVVLVTVTVTGDQAVHDMADPLSDKIDLLLTLYVHNSKFSSRRVCFEGISSRQAAVSRSQ